MRKSNIQVMAEIAIFATLAYILDVYTQPLKLGPWISISFKMVPIFILSYRQGAKAGMTGGFIWGILQVVTGQAGSSFLNLTQGILEYFVAFALIGTAGFLKPLIDKGLKDKKRGQTLIYISTGILLGSFCRYLIHFIAGMIFWGHYAPEGTSVFMYSLSINGASFLGESIVSIITVWLLSPLIHFLLSYSKK